MVSQCVENNRKQPLICSSRERVSGHQWKGLGIDDRINPRTGASERITLAHCAGVGRGVVVVPVRCQESLRYVLLTVSARVRLRFLGVHPFTEVSYSGFVDGTVYGIYPWVDTLVMGNLMGRRFG